MDGPRDPALWAVSPSFADAESLLNRYLSLVHCLSSLSSLLILPSYLPNGSDLTGQIPTHSVPSASLQWPVSSFNSD